MNSPQIPQKLGVIGLGVMGEAIVRQIQTSFPNCEIWGVTKSEESANRKSSILGITVETDFENLMDDTDFILLAVKPAQVKKVLKKLDKTKSQALICSIAAGVTTKQIEEELSKDTPVIRAMPNTPCMIGEGVIAVCGGTHTDESDIQRVLNLFACLGQTFPVEERLFDAVTGLSGSGPAYFFLIMEALADGGVRVGLPRSIALEMVAQTMLGAAKMAKASDQHPAALRDEVTTPAGCTIGALLIMEDGRIRSILARAIEEATRIASELGNTKK